MIPLFAALPGIAPRGLMAPKQILALCSPDEPFEKTVALVKAAMRTEPSLDIQMTNLLLGLTNAQAPDKRVAMRMLEILDQVSSEARLTRLICQLLQLDDPPLRSKAALLVSRRLDGMDWIFAHLQDADPRVRANILEGLWENTHPACTAVFARYRDDSNNRVAANAVYGLYLRGEADAIPNVMRMASHANPTRRAAAAWLMGMIGRTEFVDVLKRMVKLDERQVKGTALKSLVRINRSAGPARNTALETTATRDGAVACPSS